MIVSPTICPYASTLFQCVPLRAHCPQHASPAESMSPFLFTTANGVLGSEPIKRIAPLSWHCLFLIVFFGSGSPVLIGFFFADASLTTNSSERMIPSLRMRGC
jgi:hypothetical protein